MPEQTFQNFASKRLVSVRKKVSAASIIGCAALFAFATALGQPPYELPKDVPDTDLQEIVVPLSDAVKRKITEALSRDGQRDAASGSTGDPILDDVLNVIRRQGSVLDGSSLDPQPGISSQENISAAGSMQQMAPPGPTAIIPLESERSLSRPDARFHVAESLLRAARMLAALPGRDEQRNRVIAAMREQATVLMIDEFSQLPTDSQ